MVFTQDELARYARHLSLSGFGAPAQEKLKNARVLVIGVGGLGCPALLYLAAAGVGRIEILDADRVDLSNLQRQVLFTTEDAGQLKVEVAARRLRALNPLIQIVPRAERFKRSNALERVRECDVVVDGSDNFATRYLVNDACVIEGKPFIYGAIQRFEGQVSVFNWQGGPTYRCLFPEPAPSESVPNCSEAGVLGVLPGLIGTVQATEAIKLLTGVGEPLSGRLLLWDALTMRMRTLALAASPSSQGIRELPLEPFGQTCVIRSNARENEIDVSELRATLAQLQLIDVRDEWERSAGTILPSVHLPWESLESAQPNATLLQLDPAKATVLFCAVGVRSQKALALLCEHHGFTHVRSLRGGYQAWNA
ncbi:putative adenylyltransferase/sulfurtransferase MoeZ [mine drainage metagenome]|uniref:Putative adenylyltransferase/sulfurtransferase MoeZ n=1 Tax=mine drainage metagenome TaxID=410659 RepID=A0A1J5Q7M5_9ZZZZ